MVPIRLRQQRVRPVTPVAADKGKTVAGIERWPALSAFAEEQRQGGGTLLDADPEGILVDWPMNETWSQYQACTKPHPYCNIDSRLGNSYLHPRPAYSRGGFQMRLSGTTDDMLEQINQLEKYEFLGGATRGVFVDICGYFPGENLYALVSILFEISPSDVAVSPSISIHVSDLRSLVLYLAACADPSNLQPLVLVMACLLLACCCSSVALTLKLASSVNLSHAAGNQSAYGSLSTTQFS